jgi:hypothetical protein
MLFLRSRRSLIIVFFQDFNVSTLIAKIKKSSPCFHKTFQFIFVHLLKFTFKFMPNVHESCTVRAQLGLQIFLLLLSISLSLFHCNSLSHTGKSNDCEKQKNLNLLPHFNEVSGGNQLQSAFFN